MLRNSIIALAIASGILAAWWLESGTPAFGATTRSALTSDRLKLSAEFIDGAAANRAGHTDLLLKVSNAADVPLKGVDVRVEIDPCVHDLKQAHFRLYKDTRRLVPGEEHLDAPFNGRWLEWHLNGAPASSYAPAALRLPLVANGLKCVEINGSVNNFKASATFQVRR